MAKVIAEVHEWRVEDTWDYHDSDDGQEEEWGVVRRLEENWKRFERGGHHHASPPQGKKKREKQEMSMSGSEDEKEGRQCA